MSTLPIPQQPENLTAALAYLKARGYRTVVTDKCVALDFSDVEYPLLECDRPHVAAFWDHARAR